MKICIWNKFERFKIKKKDNFYFMKCMLNVVLEYDLFI